MKKFREKRKLNTALAALSAIVVPVFYVLTSEYIDRFHFFDSVRYVFNRLGVSLIGYIPLVLIFVFLMLATRRPFVSAAVLGVFNVLIRYANLYKKTYLQMPVLLSDVNIMGDAVTITSEYEVPFYKEFWIGLLMVLVITLLLVPVQIPKRKTKLRELIFRAASCIVVFAVFIAYFPAVAYNKEVRRSFGYLNRASMTAEYSDNTFYSGFFVNSESALRKKPEGYNKQAVEQIGEELQAIDVDAQHTPDIIVVLVESWEFMEEYEGVTFSQNIHPFYDELKQEAITGQMVSSQYGGGTAQIEFEVLTGFSTDSDILPLNAYNSYTYENMPSLPTYLKTQGYTNYAFHPFNFSLYNRPTVYENLKFDEIYDEERVEIPYTYGAYISDMEAVKTTIDIYENAVETDDHVFLQLITMQNHGPYIAETISDEQRLVRVASGAEMLSPEETVILENYASQMYMTDWAMSELIKYFRGVDREVIIVIYGDHQANIMPVIGGEYQETLLRRIDFYENNSDYDAAVKTHLTPYLIWSNYQAPSTGSFGYLAPNQLLPYALHEFDAARPAYFEYMYTESAAAEVKARSGDFVLLADETIVTPIEDVDLSSLSNRNILEYDLVLKKGKELGDYAF